MKIVNTMAAAAGALVLATAAQANPVATEQAAQPPAEAQAEAQTEAQAGATVQATAPAALDSVLVTGAEVVTADNQPLGKIAQVDGDNVVMTLAAFEERPVAFKREHFTVNQEGKLASVFTSEQITAGLG